MATQRSQARAQALQAQAIRMAVWGGEKAFAGFVGHLAGGFGATRRVADAGEADAALAAFGLRAEE